MEITIVCNDCDTPLYASRKLEGDKLTFTVTPCPRCIARKILMAEDQEWVRAKLLREGGEG